MSLGVGAAGACGGGAVQRMQVAVPHDIEPGQVFEVQTPGGRMRVTYPLAAVAGETILIDVPRTQRMSPPTATSRPDASRSGEYLAARRASNATYEAEAALRREGDAEDSLALQLGIAASLHDLDREAATETDEEAGRRLAQAVSGSELDARHADRVRTADRLVRGMRERDAAAAAMGGASHAQAEADYPRDLLDEFAPSAESATKLAAAAASAAAAAANLAEEELWTSMEAASAAQRAAAAASALVAPDLDADLDADLGDLDRQIRRAAAAADAAHEASTAAAEAAAEAAERSMLAAAEAAEAEAEAEKAAEALRDACRANAVSLATEASAGADAAAQRAVDASELAEGEIGGGG